MLRLKSLPHGCWCGLDLDFRCYLANFFLKEMVGAEEVALNPIGARALTFIPRILQVHNSSAILSDFGHPISLCIHVMASILSIGLGVGVAAFLVCDGVSGRCVSV
jgi:hypothetical protein